MVDSVIARLKRGPTSETDYKSLGQLIQRLKSRSNHSEVFIDHKVVERLTLESRRLRRLNEAQTDDSQPEFRTKCGPVNHVIERLLESRCAVEEADVMMGATLELPRHSRYEPVREAVEDFETMRMEIQVQNDWCEKIMRELELTC